MRFMNLIPVLLACMLWAGPWAGRAFAEGESKDIFEGWEDTGKGQEGEKKEGAQEKKEEAVTQPAEVETAAPVVEESEPVRSQPEVGLGAAAPGSHDGVLPAVTTRYGSLQLLGVFQTYFHGLFAIDDDDNTDAFAGMGFHFQRARIMLQGHVISEDLEYFFQGEAGYSTSFALDMVLSYRFSPDLKLKVGRFVPDFSFMMPRNVADLAAIEYPVYLTAPGAFAVWRQLGAQVNYSLDQLKLAVGVFNGLERDPFSQDPLASYMGLTASNLGEVNKAKDFLIRADYLMDQLDLALNVWLGMPPNATDPDENDFILMAGPGAEYNDGTQHIIGEFMFRTISFGNDADSITSLAAWAHYGYRVSELLEVIGRIDWMEPNLDGDADMFMRLTGGAHFWLEEKHFRILLNLLADIPLEGDGRTTAIALVAQFAALW